jgi:hypothetical protein
VCLLARVVNPFKALVIVPLGVVLLGMKVHTGLLSLHKLLPLLLNHI